MEKICQLCGQSFTAKSNVQKYCKRKVVKSCSVCGELFTTICSIDAPTTCDKPECKKLAGSASMSTKTKVCAKCGRTFVPKSSRQLYCNLPEIRKCAVCGKNFEARCGTQDDRHTCSKECKDKYAKMKSVNYFKSTTRRCKWCGQEFHPTSNTSLYCDRPHYQTCVVCGKTFSLKLLGKDLMAADIPSVCSDDCASALKIQDSSKGTEYVSFKNNPMAFITAKFDDRPTIDKLSKITGTSYANVRQILIDSNSLDYVDVSNSAVENEIVQYIKEITDTKVIIHDRKVIGPKEIDIYLPEKMIGIEVNPTYTHNSSVGPYGEAPLDYRYHYAKSMLAESKGIFIFHIFGYEWTHKKAIVTSMLSNLLGENTDRIYARKCWISEVSAAEARSFLDENHRQGYANAPIRFGLFDEETAEMVSIMTFGKMRKSIGTSNEDLSDCYELVRFCSKLNTSVVGGASKLFKHFVNTYNPTRIRSFSDVAHTRGNLYSALGFKFIRQSDPGYVWVDSRTDLAYHRYNSQKQNIRKFLHDDKIDLSLPESEIMKSHGFVQVFDCGTKLWEWRND